MLEPSDDNATEGVWHAPNETKAAKTKRRMTIDLAIPQTRGYENFEPQQPTQTTGLNNQGYQIGANGWFKLDSLWATQEC